MTALRVRGFALPEGEPVDLYADGDRWTTEPVGRAELVAEGWLVPGLVDAHTHPGAKEPGDPLDESVLRDDLHQHVAAAVTMIRSPGLAGDPPSWFGHDDDVPRAVHAGRWIAQHGQFFDGWGRRADLAELPEIAAEQAGRTGWVKLIADWMPGDDVIPASVLCAVAEAVYAVGGRVAAKASEAGVTLLAGTDSRPHGRIADEIRALVHAGVPPHDALGAASWSARSYLGLAGLEPGAPADVVVYDADPRSDLTQLDRPRAVVLRGRLR
jgi:imidazolonepropionase-like amidohydrolase